MAKGDLLGRIDCETCGTKDGMRITEDKNGDPFGYCDARCHQQKRIGGRNEVDRERVEAFYKKYPHVRRPGTVTDTGSEIPVTVPDTVPGPKKSGKASALEIFGVTG
ncbi:hypothetical protein [Nitrosovibrio sp. Nv4]|uniref:hypothetical protein n=1 Tax=Nitrosovibrio sp. Nv4 TaxID=1945880 RepID=UPI000BC4B797|nr:hypothetical protein [Nitrosovibrio sp. Nv4]SOD41615.1 hypothetical protein SAMN06298226_1917 [Nitrosovibrio sp. Nv4]